MPTVTSRIVAEIYRGIDFPAGWADKPDYLNIGMALNTVVSVAAMFDAENRIIALCWCMHGSEERFACAESGTPVGTSLANALNDDLARESRRLGTEDLLGTLLWAPDEFRPDQGQRVQLITFAPGFTPYVMRPLTGWNIPPRTLVTKAGQLLTITRAVDENLAFPMPTSLEAMHRHMGKSDPHVLTVLPGSIAAPGEKNVGEKLVMFFAALLVAGALISAWLLNQG